MILINKILLDAGLFLLRTKVHLRVVEANEYMQYLRPSPNLVLRYVEKLQKLQEHHHILLLSMLNSTFA